MTPRSSPMRYTICLALLAACHAAPAPTVPTTPARLADHRLRSVGPPELSGGEPANLGGGITIIGDVISAVDCYPEGPSARFVADAHYLYAYVVNDHVSVPPDPNGRPLPHPSSTCTGKRYRVPSGLEAGGVLKIVEAARSNPPAPVGG
ncbi:hypothetical protein BH11MYX1_BH11MYX1_53770 [soil metagenome]